MGKRFASWVLARPVMITVVGLLLTFIAGAGLLRIEVSNDLKEVLHKDNPVRLALDHLDEVFGASETIVVKVSHPEHAVFSPEFLSDLRRVSAKLKKTRGVMRVQSLATVDRFQRDEEGGLSIEKYLASTPRDQTEADDIKLAVKDDRTVRNAFLSDDDMATAIYIDPKPTVEDDAILDGVRNVLAKGLKGYDVALTGMAPIRESTNKTLDADMLTLMPVVSLVLLIFLWFALRSVAGVLITLGLISLSILPAAGVMGMLGIPISAHTSSFPVLILAIVCGDSIHVLTTYYGKLRAGIEQRQAVDEVVRELALPIFLTSATSAAGFLGMLSSPLPPMGGLGITVAVGIMWAWGLSTLVLPSILLMLRKPELPTPSGRFQVSHILETAATAVIHHTRLTFGGVAVVLLVLLAAGLPMLQQEVRPEHTFPEGSPLRTSAVAIDEAFRSSAPLEIVVHGDSKDPELFKKIDAFSERVRKLPAVGSVDSAADIVTRINETLTGSPGIPSTSEMLGQTLLLYSISGSPDVYQRLVATDGNSLRVTVRLPSLPADDLNAVVDEIRRIGEAELGGVDYLFSGPAVLVLELNELVFQSAILSIALALGMVFILCALAFRSPLDGLEAMAPLIVAVLGVLGLMGLTGIPITVASALIMSIVIGVGVDFGVHFQARWNLLANYAGEDRIRETVHEVGRPILLNAVTVAAGLAVLSISSFVPIRQLGFMAVFAMLAAAFGALVLLPLIKKLRSKESSNASVSTI